MSQRGLNSGPIGSEATALTTAPTPGFKILLLYIKILSHTCRYIDDVGVVNYNFFDRHLHKIYPDILIVNRNGDDCTVPACMDVLVRVGQNGFNASVGHKVDDISFPVVLYTFPGSNVPIKMDYHVFSSQLLRFTRICSVKEDFVECAEKIFSIMLNGEYLAD